MFKKNNIFVMALKSGKLIPHFEIGLKKICLFNRFYWIRLVLLLQYYCILLLF